MPCSGPRDSELTDAERGYPRLLRAALCAVLTTLRRDGELESVLGACDWNAAGITRAEVELWWAMHQREDAERRRQESRDATLRQRRREALDKLTPDEIAAIRMFGLND